jgi:hypothetical protein
VYRIQNVPNSTGARLRIGDFAGQDKMSIAGMQLVPDSTTSPGATEQHVIKITTTKTFDGPLNVGNAGTYRYALRTGGQFKAAPGQVVVNDSVRYEGIGTFSASLVNRQILSANAPNNVALSLSVAAPPTASNVSFSGSTNSQLGQVDPTYPQFTCNNGAGACKPAITHTLTVTLKGPDTFVLTGGSDGFGALCSQTLSSKQEKLVNFLKRLVAVLEFFENRRPGPNPRLRSVIDRINAFLLSINNGEPTDPECPGATLIALDMAIHSAIDAQAAINDGAAAAVPGTGTIVLVKRTSDGSVQKFDFEGSGNGIPPTFDITTDSEGCDGPCGTGSTAFSGLTTEGLGGSREIRETGLPEDWSLTSVSCTSEVGEGTSWQQLYDNGEGPLVGVTVINLANNDTLTCTFDNQDSGGYGGGGGLG